MKGKLVIIEGLDGSGKSTQAEVLKQKLEARPIDFMQIKLPDYESRSSELVKMYLSGEFGTNPGDVNAYAASAFYAVDRVANYITRWREDYDGGTLIIADRYTTSNACHQLQKLPRREWDGYLKWLEDFEYGKLALPRPDIVFFLDMPVDVSQALMSGRYGGDEEKKDIHEINRAYLKSCREAALYAADRLGWRVISCSEAGAPRSIESIGAELYSLMSEELLKT
jgi:dTMP kinase